MPRSRCGSQTARGKLPACTKKYHGAMPVKKIAATIKGKSEMSLDFALRVRSLGACHLHGRTRWKRQRPKRNSTLQTQYQLRFRATSSPRRIHSRRGISARIPARLRRWRASLGFDSLDALIDATVPPAIRLDRPLNLPVAKGEHETLRELRDIGKKNTVFRSFIGAGYDASRRR